MTALPLLFAASFFAALSTALALHARVSGRHRRLLRALLEAEERRLLQARGGRMAEALRRGGADWARSALDRLALVARLGGGSRSARRLQWAGVPLAADQFAALRLLLAGAGAAFGLLLGGWAFGVGGGVPAGVVGAVLGRFAPDAWLSAALTRRRATIDGELLYFLDLMALTAQAGLALDAAVAQVAAEFPGHLSAAFAGMQRQRGLGQWSEHALADLAERLGHPDVHLVCEALNRAGRFGAGTAHALRELAAAVRARRQLAMQEQANRAGAAIVVPVAVFILPAIVLILAYPALTLVTAALGSR